MKKTKIVCTIGPASWDHKVLSEMIEAGMNVARINASFADFYELDRVSRQIWSTDERVAVMLDTKGHKTRITNLTKPIKLEDGEDFILSVKPKSGQVGVSYENLAKDIKTGNIITLDDGKIELRVKSVKGDEIRSEVLCGGELQPNKTLNIPGVSLSFPELTKKDQQDIAFAVEHGFDFISASFVRNVDDVKAIKEFTQNSNTQLIAKVEDSEGVSNFDKILHEVDGIMIARGDLGIEIPMERVPILQKEFIKKCLHLGKPVIVATHMLESMVENRRATRAEVNDVANAILDGTDAVMLSAETSVGKYPVEAVKTVVRIAEEIEQFIEPEILSTVPVGRPMTNAISKAVIEVCESLPIKKILVATASGTTAKVIARHHPRQPIYAFTRERAFMRHLALTRGVSAEIFTEEAESVDLGVEQIVRLALEKGLVREKDLVCVVAGANIMGRRATNMLEVETVKNLL